MSTVRAHGMALRHMSSLGFNDARQGAMMSGRTSEHDVVMIVYWAALRRWFPDLVSPEACVAFVERNMEVLRSVVERKLISGNSMPVSSHTGRREPSLFVEVGADDVARSRRWLLQ